ncbi:MAG: rhomboid family intramembrane serine protease [Anaerolineae bacterium]|nr:rhomboid family intramembrane serine protease [Anaerolineae bacterium]
MNDSELGPAIRPISYRVPTTRPVVTYVLLGAVILVFLVETALGGSTSTDVLVMLGAKVTPLIAEGEYWRLFTAMFLHIGLAHLFFNGYALLAIGTELERLFGSMRFAIVYFVTGLFGSLASYAFSYSLSVGASGAIFGIVGALAAFFWLHRDRFGAWGRTRLANIAFLIAINLFLGFTQAGIDNLGHMGGLVSGFALGWALAPHYALDPDAQRVIDQNRPTRYWPAVAAALLLLMAGIAAATVVRRDSAEMLLYQGREAITREAWQEAVDQFEAAISADPDAADADAYFGLGLAHNHLNQPVQAAQAYEQALALDPDDSASHWNLALTYLDLARHDLSREHFQEYLRLNPRREEEVRPYLEYLDSQ